MNKIIKIYILVALIVPIVAFTSCFDDEGESIKVVISCSDSANASFTGTYKRNGGTLINFTSTDITGTNPINMHIYENEIEDVDDITINVTKISTATLTILIFKDDKLVKDSSWGATYTAITFDYDNN